RAHRVGLEPLDERVVGLDPPSRDRATRRIRERVALVPGERAGEPERPGELASALELDREDAEPDRGGGDGDRRGHRRLADPALASDDQHARASEKRDRVHARRVPRTGWKSVKKTCSEALSEVRTLGT